MPALPRSQEQLEHHYRIERSLADRLRQASPEARRTLFSQVYDELFRQVPDHPQLLQKASLERTQTAVHVQMRLLAPFLRPDMTYLELGPGDCALAAAVAGKVKKVYAVDVSLEVSKGISLPPNLHFCLSDGVSVPVPPASVQLAFSNQLMEHLHPDDARDQLTNICQTLAPGGRYLCLTPSRLSGPHDISRYFDPVATGFHLKEYTVRELEILFREAGFSQVKVLLGARGHYLSLPPQPLKTLERGLDHLPPHLRTRFARHPLGGFFLGIQLLGIK